MLNKKIILCLCVIMLAVGCSTSKPVVTEPDYHVMARATPGTVGTFSNNEWNYYANLATALAAVGVSPSTVLITGSVSLSTHATIPANVTLEFAPGGSITIPAGVNLVVQGPLKETRRKVFYGDGDVSLSTRYNTEISFLPWFDSGDIKDALEAALASGPQKVIIPEGDWTLSDTVSLDTTDMVAGVGPESNIVMSGTTYAFEIDKESRVKVMDLQISRASYVYDEGGGVYITGDRLYTGTTSRYCVVEGVLFSSLGKPAVRIDKSADIAVKNCRFYLCHTGVQISNQSINVMVSGNEMSGRGYLGELVGNFMDVYGVIAGTGLRPTGGDLDTYSAYTNFAAGYNPEGVTVVNNHSTGTAYGITMDLAYGSNIQNNIIDAMYDDGLVLRGSAKIDISGNWVGMVVPASPFAGSTCVVCWYSGDIKARGNTFQYYRYGMDIKKSSTFNIIDNTFYAIDLPNDLICFAADSNSNDLIIKSNRFYSTIASTIDIDNSYRLNIQDNILYDGGTGSSSIVGGGVQQNNDF